MRTLALLALVGGAAADDAPLSEAETERLLREAAGWRSGQRNGTRSLRRAVEMYALAADRGSGAGARGRPPPAKSHFLFAVAVGFAGIAGNGPLSNT